MKIPIKEVSVKSLNIVALESYLQKKNSEFGKIHSYETLTRGVFNDTYILKTDQGDFVLRKEVNYHANKMKLNSMEREYQIMSIMNAYFDQVPTPIIYCNDESIIGNPFFIVERKKGTVLNTKFIGNYREEIGRSISEEMLNLLVDLHSIDYKQTALKDMFESDDFLKSHVEEWIERYHNVKNTESPNVDLLIDWLRKEMPKSKYTSIIHGEFTINNVMFDKNLTKLTGLFDLELMKVGDPLIDLGIMLSYWVTEEDPMFFKQFYMKSPVTVLPGFYTQNEMIMRYVEKSGRDLSDLFYYRIYACFQLATMTQQNYLLYEESGMDIEAYKWMPIRVGNIMKYAHEQIKGL